MDEDKNSENQKLSLCNVLKSDTSEIIKKLESQAPKMFQNYSDLYIEYLHILDDLFGTCYISEKQFFDKLNIDPGILNQLKENSKSIKKNYLDFLDMNAKYFDEYFKMRILAVKTFDDYIHVAMQSYAKALSVFNKINPSK